MSRARKKNPNQDFLPLSTPETSQTSGETAARLPPLAATSDQFRGALLGWAIGDALGWPLEFATTPASEGWIKSFRPWRKRVGGRWWGYSEDITPGSYSDDTQLTLAVARCVKDGAIFDVERFAYLELPLWLDYQRGGGRSVKAAAKSLKRRPWYANFYNAKGISYTRADGNGVAMRNLPIALVFHRSLPEMALYTFQNTISTHGHPRAYLGALIVSVAVAHLLQQVPSGPGKLTEAISTTLDQAVEILKTVQGEEPFRSQFFRQWVDYPGQASQSYIDLLDEELRNAKSQLEQISQFCSRPPIAWYKHLGALSWPKKSEAVTSANIAIYLVERHCDDEHPWRALEEAVTQVGSDTDTIGAFVGGLLGARYGLTWLPDDLATKVQDAAYLEHLGEELFDRAKQVRGSVADAHGVLVKQDSRADWKEKRKGWEKWIKDFAQNATPGLVVPHPALGEGKVTSVGVKPTGRSNYVTKVVDVLFKTGQTCRFHMRYKIGE